MINNPIMSSTTQNKLIAWEAKYLHWILSILISVGLAVSGFMLKEAYTKIENIGKDVQELKVSQASTSANRFSSNDWMVQKTQLDEQKLQMEKRVISLEECSKNIMTLLTEIRQDIKELKQEHYK